MIPVRDEKAIECMRESNRRLGVMLDELTGMVRPGITTAYLDEQAEKLIEKLGGRPNFKGYEGFPACICASVNEEIVHGIPSVNRVLKDGDIISIDTGMVVDGYHSDAARTVGVGEISPQCRALIEHTRSSFFAAMKAARAGNRLYDISGAVASYIEDTNLGYGIVKELTGHGIGTDMHEKPMIPNYHKRFRGPRLRSGNTLAIEPMITMGRPEIEILEDDWTVVSSDGSWAAHYENTILITEGDPEILSLGDKEKEMGI
ncbi:MAG: type I methionyl aminopeptidase [Lachnospiraceae bacterium]|nr:type I methionyl aminopeptidase [Lachnospiraceae bacterium]